MGAGIAGAFVRRGVPALMLDVSPAALEKGVAAIQKVMEDRVRTGRMGVEEVAAALARLSTSLTLNAFADRDLVVEAIIENEAEKVRLYQEVQKIIAPSAILASNTSTISITRMAKTVQNPERFAGMHFFNPVDRMQLVEVIRGEKTSDQTVATLVATARRIGKSPIVVKDCPGFLVNRILFPYLNEAMVLLEEGADPRAIDKAALAFGMPMGPITLQDVVGLDTSLYAGKVIEHAYPDRAAKSNIVGLLAGWGRSPAPAFTVTRRIRRRGRTTLPLPASSTSAARTSATSPPKRSPTGCSCPCMRKRHGCWPRGSSATRPTWTLG